MPLTAKGEKIKHSMEKTYGSEKKAESVLYASKNKGTITGIDSTGSPQTEAPMDAHAAYMDSMRRGFKKS